MSPKEQSAAYRLAITAMQQRASVCGWVENVYIKETITRLEMLWMDVEAEIKLAHCTEDTEWEQRNSDDGE